MTRHRHDMPLENALRATWTASMYLAGRFEPKNPREILSAVMIDLVNLCGHSNPTVSNAAKRAAQRFGIMGEI